MHLGERAALPREFGLDRREPAPRCGELGARRGQFRQHLALPAARARELRARSLELCANPGHLGARAGEVGLARPLRFLERGRAARERRGGPAFIGEVVHGDDEFRQPVLGDLARVELFPGELPLAQERPCVVPIQRLAAIVEKRKLRQRRQCHARGGADDDKVHRRRRLRPRLDVVADERQHRGRATGVRIRVGGPEGRMRDDALAIPALLSKEGCEQRRELVARQFPHVEVVGVLPALGIDWPVGGRDHQHAGGGQDAPELREHLLLLLQMLDGLERDDEVDAGIGERQGRAGTLDVAEVGRDVAGARVRDRVGGDVDPHDLARAAGEDVAAIAFAAGGVEHGETAGERLDEAIAMPMLVPDRAGHFGREAFAGEREGGWSGGGQGGRGGRVAHGAPEAYLSTRGRPGIVARR